MSKQREKFIPSKVTLVDEKNAIDREARQIVRDGQSAWKRLQGMDDVPDLPVPCEVTHSWCDQIIDERITAIEAAPFLNARQKDEMSKYWRGLRGILYGYSNAIQKMVETFGDAVVIDPDLHIPYVMNLTSIINEKAERTVPTEASIHWNFISEIWRAIDTMRSWEAAEDVVKVPLQDLLTMQPEQLAARWATGAMTRNHDYDNKPYMRDAIMLQRMREQQMI